LLSTSLEPFRVELQKLADQLTAFAKSEDFETLKASLGKLFDDGTKAFDNFISHLDWNQLVDGAEKAVTEAGKSIAELKNNLASVATVLNTIGASIGVVFRAVAVVFDLAKVAISGTEAALTSVTLAASRQIDKLTGSTSQVTIALEAIQQAASDAAGKGLDALRENSDKVVGNLEKLGGVADETGKKVENLNKTFQNVKGGADPGTRHRRRRGSSPRPQGDITAVHQERSNGRRSQDARRDCGGAEPPATTPVRRDTAAHRRRH